MHRPTVWIAAVHVDCGVRRQMSRDGIVADVDLELRKWKDPARGALQQHRVGLGQCHFGRILVPDEIQPSWSLCTFFIKSTFHHVCIYFVGISCIFVVLLH